MPSITRRQPVAAGRRATAEAQVLAAAGRLLTRGANFTELGVQQIAAEAHVARSTFYAHFESKTDLLMRLAATTMGTSFGLTSAWRPADGVEGLTATFVRVTAVFREHAAVLRAISEVASYDSTVRDFWNEQLARFTESTIEAMREEQRAGRTPDGIDAGLASRLIVVGGEQAIVDQVRLGDPADDAEFARELAATWWYGVYRRPARG